MSLAFKALARRMNFGNSWKMISLLLAVLLGGQAARARRPLRNIRSWRGLFIICQIYRKGGRPGAFPRRPTTPSSSVACGANSDSFKKPGETGERQERLAGRSLRVRAVASLQDLTAAIFSFFCARALTRTRR